MTLNPEISVLTIVYNDDRYISEAIDSILAQSYSKYEYIIVDNDSTDSTPQILESYEKRDKRIRVIKEKRRGIFYARNTGLKIARGKWVAILDADDIASHKRLEYQFDHVKKNPNVILLGSGCILIDENGKGLKTYSYPGDHKALVSCLENQKAFFPHSSSLYNRQTAVEMGGYRSSYAEDYDLWLRLSMCGNVACIPSPLIKLRRSVSSNSYNVSEVTYRLHNMTALVLYLRRKMDLREPNRNSEEWEVASEWIRRQMEDLKVFEKVKALREMNRLRYSTEFTKMGRLSRVMYKLISNRYARDAFLLDRSYMKKAAVKIAEASKDVF